MTTAKYINTTVSYSYNLNQTNYDSLTIGSMGQVNGTAGAGAAGGFGVNVGFAASVENDGTVNGGSGGGGAAGLASMDGNTGYAGAMGYAGGVGLNLYAGGSLNNTGAITGGAGGIGGAGGYGTITGGNGGAGGAGGTGLNLGAGATLTNTGMIVGGAGGAGGAAGGGATPGTVGSAGAAGDGLVASAGANITNGSATNATALISGGVGVYANASYVTVTNFGTLQSTTYGGYSLVFKAGHDRLIVESGSTFDGNVFGGYTGTAEMVSGTSGTLSGIGAAEATTGGVAVNLRGFGAYLLDAGSTWTVAGSNPLFGRQLVDGGAVTNIGSIQGGNYLGVTMLSGATLTNGSGMYPGAQISGSHGVYASSSAANVSVTNYGSIIGNGNLSGSYGSAVLLKDGGTVINGSEGDTGALIQSAPNAYNGFYGSYGVKVTGGSGTVTNFGTVTGGSGVALYDGGSLTNGSATDTTALIQATSTPSGNYIAAVYVGGAAGTVSNFGTIDGPKGVFVRSSATVINGSSTDSTALIEGAQGVQISSGTVVNYGSITGGVSFGSSASDRLIAESGSSIVGGASGGGGSLELASGTGTITGFGGSGVVSGDINLGFSGFNNYALDAGSSWTLTGAETIGAGQRLANIGSLEIDVSLTVDGTLYNSGAISGAGELDLAGGSSNNFKGTSVTIANLNMTGMGTTLGLQADLAYGGVFNQGAGTVLNLNSHTLTLSGTGTVLSGQVNGLGGTLLLKGGTDSVSGALSMGHLTLSSGAMMTLSQSLSYGGVFSSSHSAVNLGGKTLTLTKTPTSPLPTATFLATEFDGGALVTNGLTALEGVALGGVHWTDNGTAAQYASTTLGDGATAAVSRLTVGLHGVLAFENDTGIATANGGGAVYNYGTIVKAGGTGVSMVTAVVNNLSTVVGANTVQGKIIGTSGTLEFTQNVNGGGLAVVAGGTLAFDKSFNEFIYFAPLAPLGGKAYGEVKMAKSHAYQGDVLNFATTGLTALDLEDVAYTNTVTPTFKYTGNTSGGVLSVHSGTKTTNINFIGDYTTAIWHLTSDLNGGTVVTATAPTMRAATHAASPAATHPFVQAMASVGASHAATSAGGGHDHLASAHLLALVTPRGCAAA